MDSINFRKNIRSYNNALAFASFGANFKSLSCSGPQIIRICGKIYHNVYALHPNINEARKYGQLYVLDNEKATAQRQNHKSKSGIKAKLLSELDSLFRNINPYAKAYKMMYEVERKELEMKIHLFVFIIILLMQEYYMKNTKFSSIIPNMKKVLVKILHCI